jgi:magnesium transporter
VIASAGPAPSEAAEITLLEYGPDSVEERRLEQIADWQPGAGAAVAWINVDDVRDPEVIAHFGQRFGIHPLAVEDIHHTRQRPKLDDYKDYVFIVLKMLTWDASSRSIETEQVSLIVMPHLVLSFQERTPADVFEPVREAIRGRKGRIADERADYLAYALIDAIVDHYFVVLEALGDEIDRLEDEVVEQPSSEVMRRLQELKRELAFLRNSIWPLREVVGRLERGDISLFEERTIVYLRDVYDHTVQVAETVETFRDVAAGLLDIYLSSISNRLNSVMKVLTVISTIFIPLTFITSLYGMNFHRMPELDSRYGYPVVLAIMFIIAAAMLVLFRRNRWL